MVLLFLSILLHFCLVCSTVNKVNVEEELSVCYILGGLFEEKDEDDRLAFQLASEILNLENKNYKLWPVWSYVIPSDTFMVAHTLCTMIQSGLGGIIGPSTPFVSPYVKSVCDVKDIPLLEVNWDINEKPNNYLINLFPYPIQLAHSFVDLVKALEWESFTILYENDESLFKVSELLMMYHHTESTVALRQLNPNGDHRSIFMDLKRSGAKHYVIECSLKTLEEVLKQSQQVGIIAEGYNFIILNLDMFTIDLNPYQYGGANITGIRLINLDNPRLIRLTKKLLERKRGNGLLSSPYDYLWKLKTQTALVIDAVSLLHSTLKELNISGRLDIAPLYCNSTIGWGKGSSIINYMKAKTMNGLTGLIKFDLETGVRNEFTLDVLELVPSGLIKMGSWNSAYGYTNSKIHIKEEFPFVEENPLKNKMFTIIIALTEPYGMLKNVSATLTGNDRYEGFGIDVIDELSKLLKFRYTFVLQDDGLYGSYNPRTRKWNGMLGEIIAGRADFGITDLTITSERESAVDFTMPFMNLGISILFKKPEPAPPSLFTFAFPFSMEVWILLAVSFILVSLSFFIMGRLSPAEWTNPYPCIDEPEFLVNQFSLRNSLWFTVGSLMQQGSEIAPIAISTRMASGVWYFFVLIMVSSYTANLAAFLTVEELVTPFDNVEQLAMQEEIKYGAKQIGTTRNFFRNSNFSVYPKIKKYMDSHPESMMLTNDEGVEKAELDNYAFFMESTSIDYVTERHCNLTQVGGALDEKGYGIAMKKDSEYRHILSMAILELQESGKLAELKTKWWKEKRGGGQCEKRQPVATPLDLKNLGGVFFVLAVGTLFGIICTMFENVMFTRKAAQKKNTKFKQEARKELHFFLKFKRMSKAVERTECLNIIKKQNNNSEDSLNK